MIRYSLICADDHQFDSWFKSSADFDALVDAGHVTCAICGTTDVARALMTPSVSAKREAADLSLPENATEDALATMRKTVEDNSDYVGQNFAQEARDMHDGTAPERSIYGEAKLEDAKKLIDDGVPVMPLPFMPKRKTN